MRRTLRLRTRVTLFFAFIALLAGVVLIGVTYGFARNNLINERKTTAQNQAFVNADDVSEVLTNDPDGIGDFFDNNLRTETGGFANLAADTPGAPINEITATDFTHPITDFPQRLIDAVGAGRSATQFVTIDGSDYIAVGVAIAAHETGYFETFPLRSTERTLTAVLTALTLGAAGTLVLASLFGLATSRRLLRPLSQVADAAEEIASGGLDTRLAPESDPDLDRLAGSFNEMADAVQTRIEREARFASDVSHELRSPITALAAAVEVLDARRDDIPERTQQALDVVVSQVRRFDDMVIDLLELSRLDAGLARPQRRGTRSRRSHPSRRRPLQRARRADRRRPARHRPQVAIDKVRYERILGNLIDNAHNHGDGPVRIEIAPWQSEPETTERGDLERVSIAVEDAGPGVATSEHERIFERFARGQRGPQPDRHRTRPRPRRRAQRGDGRTRLGRGPTRRRGAVRRRTARRGRHVGGVMSRRAPAPVPMLAHRRPDGCARARARRMRDPHRRRHVQRRSRARRCCSDSTPRRPPRRPPPRPSRPCPPRPKSGRRRRIVPLEEVDIYFLSRGRLQPVPVALTTDFAPDQVVDALEKGPPPGVGLDTHIEPGLIVSTEVAEGVVTVDLDPEIFARIAASDQAEAIGQIVLTMLDNVDRVGSVLFTLAGEPTQVKKGDSLLTEPDEAVTFDDYAVLLTTSTATTSTSTTTVPAETVPDPAVPADARGHDRCPG